MTLIGSSIALSALTGLELPAEQAEVFRSLGAKTVVITCGSSGTVVRTSDEAFEASAFQMEFVDGTGSGDAFAAGFILGLLQGVSMRRCVELGSALGASCVRKTGATAGVFTRSELEQFLSENKLPSATP